MDFNKSIFENRQQRSTPFLAAHRGVCGANIPCNTLAAFQIALDQGADVIEIDVARTKDGKFFVFHPGMEFPFLKTQTPIAEMTAEEVENLQLVNQDDVLTSYKIPTLAEVLAFLKDRSYINVDKFWTDVQGISQEIRKAGVEKQVIVKTKTDEESLAAVCKYAPDFMFMPMVKSVDEVTDRLIAQGVNVIGAEVLFAEETDPVISDAYIAKMHEKKLLVWANAIVYDEKAVISAHHTDDSSLTGDPDKGWGWLIDKKVDFIQTDWLLMLKKYLEKRPSFQKGTGNFVTYAHRGASEYCPENTLLSFYTGVFMGANGIETDVQVTKDGVLVLFHDNTLARVTGEAGSVADYTYAQLQQFSVKKGTLTDKIPTFEDFLAHFSHRELTFAIELKVGGVEAQVADLIAKYGIADKVVVTSFQMEYIGKIKAYAPDLRVGYLAKDIDEAVIDALLKMGAYELCPRGMDVTAEKVALWHGMGLNVRAWGISDTQIMKKVYDAGVDGMTVNFPDLLLRYAKG